MTDGIYLLDSDVFIAARIYILLLMSALAFGRV